MVNKNDKMGSTVPILVPAVVDQILQGKWDDMKRAMINRDANAAVPVWQSDRQAGRSAPFRRQPVA